MAPATNDWTARAASALGVASRWAAAGSLVLTLGALAAAWLGTSPSIGRLLALTLIVVLGALQLYLSVRIEFDRAVFQSAADNPGGVSGFDDALLLLGWRPRGDRPLAARAAAFAVLVRWSGRLLATQFALALAALWLPA